MNKSIAILVLAVSTFAAQGADNKKKTAPAKPATPVGQPLTIPKDATPNSDGTYSYTDKAGKKWIFNKTPFGISRTQDMTSAPIMSAAPAGQFIKATETGDTVKFERQTPFGTTKWEKKKTDLNDEERAAMARQAAASTDKQPE